MLPMIKTATPQDLARARVLIRLVAERCGISADETVQTLLSDATLPLSLALFKARLNRPIGFGPKETPCDGARWSYLDAEEEALAATAVTRSLRTRAEAVVTNSGFHADFRGAQAMANAWIALAERSQDVARQRLAERQRLKAVVEDVAAHGAIFQAGLDEKTATLVQNLRPEDVDGILDALRTPETAPSYDLEPPDEAVAPAP